MPQPQKPEPTAANLLEQVGRALFDNAEDWPSQLAASLDVRRDTIRKWLHGRIPFGPDHPVLDRLLALVIRRRRELNHVEGELWGWLARNRTPGDGA
jgi:hypothetical protein